MRKPPSTRAVAELLEFVKTVRVGFGLGLGLGTIGVFFDGRFTAALLSARCFLVLTLLSLRIIVYQDAIENRTQANQRARQSRRSRIAQSFPKRPSPPRLSAVGFRLLAAVQL